MGVQLHGKLLPLAATIGLGPVMTLSVLTARALIAASFGVTMSPIFSLSQLAYSVRMFEVLVQRTWDGACAECWLRRLPSLDRLAPQVRAVPPAGLEGAREDDAQRRNPAIRYAGPSILHQLHVALNIARQQLRDCSPRCEPDANEPSICPQRGMDNDRLIGSK
jgi:hypothetical protein